MKRLSILQLSDLVTYLVLFAILWATLPYIVLWSLLCGVWLAWFSVGWFFDVQGSFFQSIATLFALIASALLLLTLAFAAKFTSKLFTPICSATTLKWNA